jgi:1-acyl-sn-glycerol-3-phosphate acyltransferase
LNLPVCPLALNSGLCWPRHSILRYPGTIVVEFLDPIPPGLSRQEFMERLQSSIETASNRLALESYDELSRKGFHPPVTGWLAKAKARPA